MPIEVRGLAADLKLLDSDAAKFVSELVVFAFQAIISVTPVDTGNARGNWIPQIGGVTGRVIGSRTNPPPVQSDGPIRGWKVGRGSITIHNSVEYIQSLDQGSSAQAPQGIVDPAIAAVEARFRRVA